MCVCVWPRKWCPFRLEQDLYTRCMNRKQRIYFIIDILNEWQMVIRFTLFDILWARESVGELILGCQHHALYPILQRVHNMICTLCTRHDSKIISKRTVKMMKKWTSKSFKRERKKGPEKMRDFDCMYHCNNKCSLFHMIVVIFKPNIQLGGISVVLFFVIVVFVMVLGPSEQYSALWCHSYI